MLRFVVSQKKNIGINCRPNKWLIRNFFFIILKRVSCYIHVIYSQYLYIAILVRGWTTVQSTFQFMLISWQNPPRG